MQPIYERLQAASQRATRLAAIMPFVVDWAPSELNEDMKSELESAQSLSVDLATLAYDLGIIVANMPGPGKPPR